MIPKLADYSSCTGCGACAATCPQNAITMDYDKNGHLMPFLDKEKCIKCGTCEKICPSIHLERILYHNSCDIKTYTCWSKNDEVASKSTSGGTFAQIALDAMRTKNAVVYGAKLTVYNTCEHIRVENNSELAEIIGTKYIQSNASLVFRDVKKELQKGKECIFSGTPCQIAGLQSYLGNINTEKLLTIEVICHGCPSKVVTDVTTEFYRANHVVSYRDKKTGWHKGFSLTLEKKEGLLIRESENYSFFFKNFGGADRPSCYKCQYAKVQRVADITLGDQWGLFEKYKNQCKYGANLVLCNTPKGESVIIKSGNIFFDLNKNNTLNAPTLFMPVDIGSASISKFLYIIKKLPRSIKYALITMDWRKGIYLLPFILWRKIIIVRYNKKFHKKIQQVRKENLWI